MKLWQKIGLITLLMVVLLGARVFFLWKGRQDPGLVAKQAEQEAAKPIPKDDLAVVRQLFISSFDAAKQLEGTTVWVKAGYSLPYYPFVDGQVQFGKRVGLLPAAEKLAIAKIQKAKAPAKEDNRVPHGSQQYFAVFSLPDEKPASGDATSAFYAAPIGYTEGGNETLFCDQLFYYDDPRTIYDNWPKDVWTAIGSHTPTVGMSENQVRMAVGILMESDSTSIGNRTVTYDAGGKKWTVTFKNDKATAVKETTGT
jgi:hypothetical protein